MKNFAKLLLITLGRIIGSVIPVNFNDYTLFFFPTFHIGGADIVHLRLYNAVRLPKKVCLFTNKSFNDALKSSFYSAGPCFDIHIFTMGIIRYLAHGYLSLCINKSVNVRIFCGTSAYCYELIQFLNPQIIIYDLIHAIETEPARLGVPLTSRIAKRIVIIDKVKRALTSRYADAAIPSSYADRIEVISNYAEVPDKFTEKDFSRIKDILFVGRFAYIKRPDLFANIARQCALEDKNMTFSMIGDYQLFMNEYPKDIFKPCRLYGEITERERLIRIYGQNQLLLVTSSDEGFPLVIMEAMAQGLIVISTAVGGICDHITNGVNGFLINSRKDEDIIKEFVQTIERLKNDTVLLRAVSANAYFYAAEHFSQKTFEKKYNKVFS